MAGSFAAGRASSSVVLVAVTVAPSVSVVIVSPSLGRAGRSVIGRRVGSGCTHGLIHLHPSLGLRADDGDERRHYGCGVVLYEIWGDDRSARKTRLAVGALILIAIAVGATAPGTAPSRAAFVAGLAVAVAASIAWASRPLSEIATVLVLALVGVGGAAVVAAGGRGAVAAIAFPLIAVAAAAERLPLRLAALVAGTAFASLLVGAIGTRSGSCWSRRSSSRRPDLSLGSRHGSTPRASSRPNSCSPRRSARRRSRRAPPRSTSGCESRARSTTCSHIRSRRSRSASTSCMRCSPKGTQPPR